MGFVDLVLAVETDGFVGCVVVVMVVAAVVLVCSVVVIVVTPAWS